MIAEFLRRRRRPARGGDRPRVLRRRRTGDRRGRAADQRAVARRRAARRQRASDSAACRCSTISGDGLRRAGAARVRSARAAGGRGAARRQHRADCGRHRPRRRRCCTTSTAASCRRRPKAATRISPPAPSARSRCVRDLTARYGRADVEHVVSGRGFFNIHPVAHRGSRARPASTSTIPTRRRRFRRPRSSAAAPGASRRSTCSSRPTAPKRATSRCGRCRPAACSSAAASRRRSCRRSRPARSCDAFLAKPPLDAMLAAMPVKVILNAGGGAARRGGLRGRRAVRVTWSAAYRLDASDLYAFCSPT